MNITRELFCEVLADVERADQYAEGLNNYFKNNNVDGYIYQPDCACSVIKLLHELCGDADKDNWISYFCYELDFGKKSNKLNPKYKGKEIDLSTSDNLYDFLSSLD